ncbi:MAG: hypothetical protein M3552_07615 [Planctomycetota bacterium]|nr:hypothetical protein [Planctomycetaceae bacterium]MDQ3330505.1 hypothetical protein [Planctomycetota bacterium]
MAADSLTALVTELHALRITLERLQVTLAALARVADDHEARVRVLERRQQSLTPVVSALAFLLGVVATELIARIL